jgi:hypothetical protein
MEVSDPSVKTVGFVRLVNGVPDVSPVTACSGYFDVSRILETWKFIFLLLELLKLAPWSLTSATQRMRLGSRFDVLIILKTCKSTRFLNS